MTVSAIFSELNGSWPVIRFPSATTSGIIGINDFL